MSLIYLIRNTINNKTYVGQQSTKDKNYYGSGLAIKRAIKKYGKQNFTKEILVEGDFSREVLNELEIHYIQIYSPHINNNSYNLTKGGEGQKGWIPTSETRLNMSLAAKKRMENPIERLKAGNGNRGKTISKEHREALLKAIKGNNWNKGKSLKQETKDKLSKIFKGRTYTDEQRKRMSEGCKRYHQKLKENGCK